MWISFNFCAQQSETMSTNMLRHKKFFWSSMKKSTKDKAILNHVEQIRVLDMSNFEIDFLSYYN